MPSNIGKIVEKVFTPLAGLAGVGQLLALTNLKLRLNQTRIEDNVYLVIAHGDVVFASRAITMA